jgi:ABC-type glutathione transport system ATPase component
MPATSPANLRNRLAELQGQRKRLVTDRAKRESELARVDEYLAIAPQVDEALEKLSQEMFGELTTVIEAHLTRALQEVLEQNIALKVTREFKRGCATMSFHVERDGQPEDIMKGQGGSVVNILSVGLRLLALTTLDRAKHRRFLVLDEQDCWLRPDLVPRLAKIVSEAGRAMGFQVLMISHHDPAVFQRYADRVYSFKPAKDGSVRVELVLDEPGTRDAL